MAKAEKSSLARRIGKGSALAAPLLFSFVLQYPSAFTRKQNTQDRGAVLADIPGIGQANPRLGDLLLLGSHDSFSDGIGWHSAMDPVEVERKTLFAHPLVMPLTKGIAARFSKAQSCGAAQQLRAGARLIDIRLTWYQGSYYTRHSIISRPFEPYLREILAFLADPNHKGEMLLLYFLSAIYPKGADITHLFSWLKNVRVQGKNIFDYVPYDTICDGNFTPLTDLRYNTVTQGGTASGAVLLMQMDKAGEEPEFHKLFPLKQNFYAPWANQISSARIRRFYREQIEEARKMTKCGETQQLHIMQAQKTLRLQDALDFLWVFRGWSLLDLAADSNKALIQKGYLDRWLTGDFQVILVDNVTSTAGDFNAQINRKIKDYNRQKVKQLLQNTDTVS